MQFQLTDTYLFWWPVTVEFPDPEKPGTMTKQEFEMQFELIGQDQADAITERASSLPPEEQKKERNASLFRACTDWRDVVGPDKKPVPFSHDALRVMLQAPWCRAAIYSAYAEALVPGAARKGN